MIRVLRYSKSKLKGVDIGSYKSTKDLYLIYCYDSSLNDLKKLTEKTKVPLHEYKHVLDVHERPRFENKKSYSLLIYRGLLGATDKKITSPIEFVFGKNFLVVLSSEEHKSLTKTFDECDVTNWKGLDKPGFGRVFYTLLVTLIKDYSDYLHNMDDDINFLEDGALHARDKDMHELFLLKRKILFLRKSITHNKDVLFSLNEGKIPFIKQHEMFHDLVVEMDQVMSSAEIIRDRITGVTEIYFTAVSNKLNEVMKSFTVIASLLLLPMLISGIYGMNIVLPFQEYPSAFSIVVGIMVGSVVLMLVFFKRKGWL